MRTLLMLALAFTFSMSAVHASNMNHMGVSGAEQADLASKYAGSLGK
ncbi:hypothetical protein [Deefgea sp. CFH1-16]|nr:hypothetical protein [Deefgea sp. CFH1-16]MBM5573408.1 hypothetical protein [Deefgea sp. CFH1-16]